MQGWKSVFGVLGIHLLEEVVYFGGSLVSRLLGFKVSWFLDFAVAKCIDAELKVSKIHLMFRRKTLVPYYQMSISCCLLDIGPISKILKNLLDGSTGFVGARLFQYFHF